MSKNTYFMIMTIISILTLWVLLVGAKVAILDKWGTEVEGEVTYVSEFYDWEGDYYTYKGDITYCVDSACYQVRNVYLYNKNKYQQKGEDYFMGQKYSISYLEGYPSFASTTPETGEYAGIAIGFLAGILAMFFVTILKDKTFSFPKRFTDKFVGP